MLTEMICNLYLMKNLFKWMKLSLYSFDQLSYNYQTTSNSSHENSILKLVSTQTQNKNKSYQFLF